MSAASDLAVVVISHGHEAFLRRCLESFEPALQEVGAQVVLIDNLGAEDLRPIVAGLHLLVSMRINPYPKGFAGNCNAAVALTDTRYVLLLNPDTLWLSGSLREALRFMDSNPDIGVLGCELVDATGKRQESCRRFPTIPVFVARVLGAERWSWKPGFYRRGMMNEQELQTSGDVDLVTGAFFLLRRSCFERIGGFDEGFFMYYEDADFCYRARLAGMRTYFYTGIRILHHHQRSSRAITSAHARWHMKSALRFFRKHRYVFRPETAQWVQP